MTVRIGPLVLTGFMTPEDRVVARAAFLGLLHNPAETWLRAYSLTMEDLADEIIAAHTSGVPVHCYLDHSQEGGVRERPIIEKMVAAGCEVTVGTSPAGSAYIAHTKALFTRDGDCWEGSVNFSESGWQQVNTAFQFNAPVWAARMVTQFNSAVVYAWAKEARMQLMAAQPVPSVYPGGLKL